MVKISTNTLLKLYLIIPFCILIVILDKLFFDGFLRRTVRPDPESYRFIAAFLFNPHLLIGVGTLLDREYFQIYKKDFLSPRLIVYSGILLTGIFWNQEIFFILFSYIGSKHLMGQQMGLEKLLAVENENVKRSNFSYHIYIIIATLIYYRVAFPQSIFWEVLRQFGLGVQIKFLITFFIFIILFFDAKKNYSKAKNVKLKMLFWGNYFIITSSAWFLQSGYFFFAFFVPRFIHDITGIIFYICHDRNRNSQSNHNFLGQILPKFSKKSYNFFLPIIIYLCIANILVQINSKMVDISLLALGTLHFYVEGFIWKKGSMHRKFVALN